MELAPKLIEVSVPTNPSATVLVLHGGASRGPGMMVSPTQLSVLRMIPIAKRIARDGGDRLAVYRLLNSLRGWDTRHTPVEDVRWALGEVSSRLGLPLATCLVGHSLGGRAALLSAGRPDVTSAVALAPWVYPTEVADGLDGQRVLIVHGTHDRVASPARSAELARRLSRSADVGYVSVKRGRHAMLRRHRVFSTLASQFALSSLLGTPPGAPLDRLTRAARWIEI